MKKCQRIGTCIRRGSKQDEGIDKGLPSGTGGSRTELINSIISLCKKNNETLEGPSTEEVHRVSEGKGKDIPNIINKVMEKGLACYNAQLN